MTETTAIKALTKLEATLRNPGKRIEILSQIPEERPDVREALFQGMVDFARNQTPALEKCSDLSKFETVLGAARLGLVLNSPLQQAYAVPFGQTCQLIVGYRGVARMMRRSGLVRNIHTGIVRERDEFERNETDFRWKADPFAGEAARGPIVGVFCVLEMTDGSRQVETMSVDEVEHVRSKSRASGTGPWVTDWPQMARKTVLRRAANLVDLSPRDARLLKEADETEFRFEDAEVEIRTPEKPRRGVAAVLDRLRGEEEPPPAAPEAPVATEDPGDEDFDPRASQGPSREAPQPARNQPPAPATGRLPLGEDLPAHQEDAARICRELGLEEWQRFTAGRQLAVAKAMKDAGISSPTQFWSAVEAYGRGLSEDEYVALGGLEDLLSAFVAAQMLPGHG
jgi:phage RecT family recombinase